MPNPMIDVSSVLASPVPEDFVSYTIDLDDGEAERIAAAMAINERRAQVENPEGLRRARAL
ncbi:MAG: hypothetical protein Q8Q88_13570 [Phenylobacterium sp.]|uniref:hypothetical protein n=1 Tax=Phenylobacterium sp. TaxID=1871053 RepID=UPI0027354D9B|nr:hypothetical protein [Phenylobacterium sp.]MDP3748066.1 hypothetical protein [Phenylobacterium sp.]